MKGNQAAVLNATRGGGGGGDRFVSFFVPLARSLPGYILLMVSLYRAVGIRCLGVG